MALKIDKSLNKIRKFIYWMKCKKNNKVKIKYDKLRKLK